MGQVTNQMVLELMCRFGNWIKDKKKVQKQQETENNKRGCVDEQSTDRKEKK